MTTTNTLGFGSLASVAWTAMDGSNLNGTQLTAVNANITANTQLANALLSAINGAVNLNWKSFALSDLGVSEAQQLTWAAQVSARLGITVGNTTELSLGEWRQLAADLQTDAAREASKRSVNSGGGDQGRQRQVVCERTRGEPVGCLHGRSGEPGFEL